MKPDNYIGFKHKTQHTHTNSGTNRANNQHTHTQHNLNWANTQHKCVQALFNVWRKTLVHSTYISCRLHKWTFMAFLRRDWTERWRLHFEGFCKQEAQIEGHTVKVEHKLTVMGFWGSTQLPSKTMNGRRTHARSLARVRGQSSLRPQ